MIEIKILLIELVLFSTIVIEANKAIDEIELKSNWKVVIKFESVNKYKKIAVKRDANDKNKNTKFILFNIVSVYDDEIIKSRNKKILFRF